MPDKIPTVVERILEKLHFYKTNEIDGNISPHLNYAINTLFEFLPKEKEVINQFLEAHKEAIKEGVKVRTETHFAGQKLRTSINFVDKESIETASKNFIDNLKQ